MVRPDLHPPEVDLVVLSRDRGRLAAPVEQGISAQRGVRLQVHRNLGEPLPDDPRLHAAGLAYLSDWASQGAVQRRFWPGFAFEGFASLDHALWLHRPARWDDWWLITAVSEIATGGRAFTRREVYTQKGELIASIAQEALVAAG
jgi:acyl-CoA thioesterase-2